VTELASDPVLYAVEKGVATITLNRPDARNALDTATKHALREAVAHAADDPSARCVVLTGTGRAFTVGQDLREHAGLLDDDAERVWRTVPDHYNPVAYALATMPKPVVAAVNGVAAGAGAAFAFACDFRVLADTAGFYLAFAGVGLSCDSGSSWSLPRLVGWAKAKELLLRPRTVGAAEALQLGLATEVVPAGEVLDAALRLARELAAGPTVAYGAIRRSLAHSASHNLADALAYEADMMRLTGTTADHRRAVASFLAKEPPVFDGR
jgi:2-(1,2-epoxy-1,2-dihydrophenyl)acetyl-CoA isomerase